MKIYLYRVFPLIAFAFTSLWSFSQSGPYLAFRNPVLESGAAGADGAKYRFSNVTASVDAIVTISGRSDGLVNLLNIDMNTSGFDAAFQPQVGYNGGTTPGAADWWMEYIIEFVATGTTNPVIIPDFNVSGVDIDGNSQYINEYMNFYDMNDYSLEAGSPLSITTLNDTYNGVPVTGKRFDGPVGNYTNIDTLATAVMVTNHYVNKSYFRSRTGGRSTDVSGAADRMYSFYFQTFSYNATTTTLLPVKTERVIRPVQQQQVNVNVYPNPSKGKVNIQLPSAWNSSAVSVRLYNLQGNTVANVYAQSNQVDLGALPNGIYMMQIVSGNQSSIHRIVKM